MDKVLALGMPKLLELMAYDLLDPIGSDRWDYRFGMLAAALLNPQRKKGAKPFRPADFIPKWDERFRPQPDVATQVNRVMGIVAAGFKEER